jgi:hypothetical protein
MIENNRFSMFWRGALRRDRMGCGHNENCCLAPVHRLTAAATSGDPRRTRSRLEPDVPGRLGKEKTRSFKKATQVNRVAG